MAHVVQHATEYVRLMSQLTPPEAFYFRTYAWEGVPGLSELCAAASSLATGEEDGSLASLVVRPGPSDSFSVVGTHATATLSMCSTPHTRLYVIAALLVAVLVLVLWLKSR